MKEDVQAELHDVAQRAAELGIRTAMAAVIALVVLLAARAAIPLLRRRLDHRGRPSHTRVLLATYRLAGWVIAPLLAMTLAFPSVRVVDLLASLGVLSLAMGLAFRGVLENLLAGVLLIWRDPFRSGDEIVIGDVEGTVRGLYVRDTLVQTPNGELVLVPNSLMTSTPLTVRTHYQQARCTVSVPLALDADVGAAAAELRAAMSATRGVLPEPTPRTLVTEIDDSRILVECQFWSSPERRERADVTDSVLRATGTLVRDGKLKLPMDELIVRGIPTSRE